MCVRASVFLAFHTYAHKFTCLSVYLPASPCNSTHSQWSSAWLCRGWLSRLEKVSSDKEEFCRLDRLLISVAVEGGNQPGPEQVGYLFTHITQAEFTLLSHAEFSQLDHAEVSQLDHAEFSQLHHAEFGQLDHAEFTQLGAEMTHTRWVVGREICMLHHE